MTFLPIMISLLVWGAAGGCLYVLLLNRRLILIPDSLVKKPLAVLMLLSIMGWCVWAAFFLPPLPWLGLPALILLLGLGGEVKLAGLRRRYAASPPVDSVPHEVDLFRPFTTMDIVTHRYEIVLPAWRGPAFRIAHLCDLHVTPDLPADYYREALTLAEDAKPDFVFFTGDFVSTLDCLPLLAGLLRPLGRRGTFAVLGNHDYWADPGKIGAVVRDSGITLLVNESVELELDGHGIRITGWDHPWKKSREPFVKAPDGLLHLVLSHTPDNIYTLSRASAHGVFSGHYHAGQVRIPGLGSVVIPSIYGRRFDHGHFVVHGTHLFVPSGVGASSPSFRIYCQPDIFLVDVASGAD